jgi:hypothetical protein
MIVAGALAVMLSVGAAPFTSEPAVANPCQHCKDKQNACRIAKKGAASCTQKFEACLQRCLQPYRKKK